MTNVEMVAELLKTVPVSYRLENYERLRLHFGLSVEDMKIVFWKADGMTDVEIEKMKTELKAEAEHKLLLNFLTDLTIRNPEGNLPFGNPESNIVKLAKLTK